MNFYNVPYSSNNSLAPFFHLLTADCTRDAKVDQPTSYSHLLRMFGKTKAGLQLNRALLGSKSVTTE